MRASLRFVLVCSLALCLVWAEDEPAQAEKDDSGMFRVEGSLKMPGAQAGSPSCYNVTRAPPSQRSLLPSKQKGSC